MPLTEEQRQEHSFLVAKAGGREVAREIFLQLGVDIDDPDSVNTLRKNLDFAESYRLRSEKIGSGIIIGITTILSGSFIYLLWDAVKMKFK